MNAIANPYTFDELLDIQNRLENDPNSVTVKESIAFLAFVADTPYEIMEARFYKIKGEDLTIPEL
jgi:hypothetical protein